MRRLVGWLAAPIVRLQYRRRDRAMLATMRTYGRAATVATLVDLTGWSTRETAASLHRLVTAGRIVRTWSTGGHRWHPTDGGAR